VATGGPGSSSFVLMSHGQEDESQACQGNPWGRKNENPTSDEKIVLEKKTGLQMGAVNNERA